MTMSTVTVRVDTATKEAAAAIYERIGLDVSTAVRMFLKQTVNRGGLPMDISPDPFYTDENLAALRESIAQAERGEVVVKTMDELKAMAR